MLFIASDILQYNNDRHELIEEATGSRLKLFRLTEKRTPSQRNVKSHSSLTWLRLFKYRFISFTVNKYVGPLYCRAEMYAGRGVCCPLVSHGEYADGTYRRTDARPLHYAFCYGPGQRNTFSGELRTIDLERHMHYHAQYRERSQVTREPLYRLPYSK